MRFLLMAAAAIVLTVESPVLRAADQTPLKALPAIDPAAVLGHVKTLASDAFEGRAPGTPGEEKTVAYLVEAFKTLGLKPGNPDGTYVQKVPLVGITPAAAPLTISGGAAGRGHGPVTLAWRDDVVAWTKRVTGEVTLDASELVFVGYGVQAPEYGWDDYKGVDVAGKTLVMLVNDPPVPDPASPSALDAKTFGGRAMTYYGRWTYKYEIGARHKAAAVLIVHETGPAGYPFAVVQGKTGEQFTFVTPGNNMDRAAIEGWITLDQAKALFTRAGQDFDRLKAQAATRAFRPVPLGLTASMTIRNTLRRVDSQNVVARLEGSDPAVKDEHVVFTAHWDHFGIGEPIAGDHIYNGAKDNATGTAALLETARAFTRLPKPPRRSILFLSVTAEEQGLLGSEYYAAQPLYPLAKTLADINMDALNVSGRTKDLVDHRARRVGAGRLRAGRGEGAGPHAEAGRRAGEGLLLPLRPLQLRQGRRARAQHRRGRRVRRQAGVVRHRGARALHHRALPQAVGRGDARLGSERPRRGRPAAVHGRLPRRPGRHVSGVVAGQRVQGDPGRAAEREVSGLTARCGGRCHAAAPTGVCL